MLCVDLAGNRNKEGEGLSSDKIGVKQLTILIRQLRLLSSAIDLETDTIQPLRSVVYTQEVCYRAHIR